MKKLAYLTIPLIAALIAGGAQTAYAADGGTIYPDDEAFISALKLTSLSDYTVGGGAYAFADGKLVKVFNDGDYKEYAFENDVTDVAFNEGVFYCGCSDGKAYTLAEQSECEYTFPEKAGELLYGGFYYFTDEDGNLSVFDKSTKQTETYEGSFSNLKLCGETVYAANGNALYSFDGAEGGEVELKYADYSVTRTITVGQAASALKNYAPATFVKIEAGTFMTAVDLEKLDGEHFVPINTVRSEEETVALLLCYSGNAALVSVGDTGYLMLKSKTSVTEMEFATEETFTAQMLGGNIYASPYIVSGTVSTPAATGKIVNVKKKLELENVLGAVFYEVEFTENESVVCGYVAEGFLSKVIVGEQEKPTEITDPEYSEDNDTKTILIILAVILLVLGAVGYISYVSSGGKRRKNKKKSKDKDGEE